MFLMIGNYKKKIFALKGKEHIKKSACLLRGGGVNLEKYIKKI